MVEVGPICRRAIHVQRVCMYVCTRLRLWPSCICDVGNESSLCRTVMKAVNIVSVISEDLKMNVYGCQ